MTTITLTGRELTALVAPVIPHASTDRVLPLLASVYVRARGPWVTAMTTDRYRIGFQRVRPTEPPQDGFAALIPLHVLARIRGVFKTTRHTDPVITLTIDDDTLRVTASDGLDGLTGAMLEFHLPSPVKDWPNVDLLIIAAINSEPQAGPSRLSVNPKYLADFRLGQPAYGPIIITSTGSDRKPFMIRVGDDFVGLIVPLANATVAEPSGWLDLLDVPAETTDAATPAAA
jgi:DNA polymerase III sliding clamp (beta) subunit (PCNA family)